MTTFGQPLLIPGQTFVNTNPFFSSFRAKDPYFCELATALHCTGVWYDVLQTRTSHNIQWNGILFKGALFAVRHTSTSAVPGSSKLTKVGILGSER